MENQVQPVECPGCKDIQQLVSTNEQMIQEQIKIIKRMHEENITLLFDNHELQIKNKKLQKELNQWKAKASNKSDQAQQTDQIEEQVHCHCPKERASKDEQELKVSTKVNIKTVVSKKENSLSKINKQNLSEILPIVNMRRDEEYFTRKRKNSIEEEHHANTWLKIMGPHITSLSPAKFKEKTIHLVKKMVPHEIRHVVWPAVCQNQLALTDELYWELQSRQCMGWVSKQVRNQIQRDIMRSFTPRDTMQNKQRLKLQVCQVLQMFHLYRPDISYVQGMTYPIIVLTIVVGKVKAFQMFSNLVLTNSFFRKLYMFEPKFIQAVSKTFQMILFDYQHEIAEKLSHLKIESQIFLVEWFYTIFSRSLTFQSTIKFWDQLLYHGQVVLFRMSLAIFELIKPHIMQTNYQETIGLIQGFGSYINEEKLFDIVVHHRLNDERVQRHIEKAMRTLSSQE